MIPKAPAKLLEVNKRGIGSDLFSDKMSRNADPRSDAYRLDLQRHLHDFSIALKGAQICAAFVVYPKFYRIPMPARESLGIHLTKYPICAHLFFPTGL
jgi:hypothetical protein